ncbi:MAG: helix-turn-helix domain-containing protein [Candidatus Eremiobacteraeota bacterium]|nr:helix-turn-helix domain-containing protein [Candidatus Eremiobacteraeota bacterium]
MVPPKGNVAGETRRQALGHFLRERREAVAPEQVGISSQRGRRTPGLRREEVAFLADIGVKWYARLEAGDQVHPSTATLSGIASALRLSNAELGYMLELAGLRHPPIDVKETTLAVPPPLATLLDHMTGIAAVVSDRILTPLRWNPLADAMHGFSLIESPLERNALVRALCDADFADFLGAERDDFIVRAVGMFRLNYSSSSPSPLVNEVYERVKDHPLFEQAWHARVIAAELTRDEITVRHHRSMGRLEMFGIDFSTSLNSDLLVRLLIPANDETTQKFARLERAGAPARGKAAVSRIG